MKRLTALLAVFLCLNIVPVHAATPKVMAIIDSGVDMSVKSIKSNIVYEVCVAGYKSCPNGTNLQEGAGSATITPAMFTNTAWNHGTWVASSAIQTDPNVKIIEIRCASLIGANGYIGCNLDMLTTALNWVVSNSTKYNIGAVVAPMGYGAGTCPTNASYLTPIKQLFDAGVIPMFAAGNAFSIKSIDAPACGPNLLAITSYDDKGKLAQWANYSSRVDFAAQGVMSVTGPNNIVSTQSGTSLSVAIFGAQWLQIENAKNINYQTEYNLIKQTGTAYTNPVVKQNVLAINIVKALQ